LPDLHLPPIDLLVSKVPLVPLMAGRDTSSWVGFRA